MTLLVSVIAIAGGCDKPSAADRGTEAKTGDVEDSKGSNPGAAAEATPPADEPRRVVAPPPEPLPPRADLAHEVPAIVAEMEKDPAYVGIWEPGRREDLDVFLTGVSALLCEGAISKRVASEIKTRKLEPVIQAVGRVLNRAGKLPGPIVAKLVAHLDATKDEDNAGLWLPRSAEAVRDYTVAAVYVWPDDPRRLRQLLAARSVRSWVGWHKGEKPSKRPWLATEIGALQRLDLLDDLTASERARVDFLAIAPLPKDATCSVVAKLFGPDSKKSSAQMDQLWPDYKGKRFSWKVKITDVTSATLGSGYSVQAKCVKSESLIQDLQLEYGEEAKDFVLGLDRDTVHELGGVLSAYTETFGLVADGHP